jgi:CRISPR-associated protein Cas5d
MSVGIKLHVWGEYACFTRPEMKVERVSYDIITPSAARGIVEAVYWKPEIRWRVTRLHVLRPIRFTSLRRNEVASKVPAKAATKVMKAGHGNLGLYVEDDRQQRAATVLRDVAYVIEARFDIVGGKHNPGKHLDQFNRRARDGQCFHRPYLGCREFAADFALIEHDDPIPLGELAGTGERSLGWMLNDTEYVADPEGPIVDGHRGEHWRVEVRFFPATMVNGVVDVKACQRMGVRHEQSD